MTGRGGAADEALALFCVGYLARSGSAREHRIGQALDIEAGKQLKTGPPAIRVPGLAPDSRRFQMKNSPTAIAPRVGRRSKLRAWAQRASIQTMLLPTV